jgi:hypothetical protein
MMEDSMRTRIRSILVPLVAVMVFAGCSDDEGPMNVVPPPDLSGTYDLSSFTQAGVTLNPPIVNGTIIVTETSRTGSVAAGDYNIDITTPAGPVQDQGTYSIDSSDGSWSQDSSTLGFQSIGTFSLVGSTLTVEVTAPAAAANTSVWQKR